DDGVIVAYNGQVMDGDFCQMTITRTWTAMDNCGNSAIATQTINVSDTSAPVLIGVPEDDEVECENIPAPAVPSATDNCDDDVTITFDEEVSTGECPYTITRTWTASDDCGNSSIGVQVITVIDTIAPVIGDYPITISVDCDQLDDLTIPVTDNCSEVTIDYIDIQFSGDCYGTLERTWIVSDACGNSESSLQYIFIEDNSAPELFNVPGDIEIECGGNIPPVPTDVFGIDNCDNDVTITFEETQSGTDCPYVITRTWTAEDDCGNEISISQNITVITPVITSDVLMSIYPNPMGDEGVMSFVVPERGYVVFEVLNNLGQTVKVVYSGNVVGDVEYRFYVDVDELNAGMFTTRLIYNDEIHVKPLIKVD
ncbi:MAG: T9SS type A sorting domain-containing protein, partial [Flavobacteriales bacterium]|nr:T9SS type A sorting domain-containing protein [Flavobacteriales bacterium]